MSGNCFHINLWPVDSTAENVIRGMSISSD